MELEKLSLSDLYALYYAIVDTLKDAKRQKCLSPGYLPTGMLTEEDRAKEDDRLEKIILLNNYRSNIVGTEIAKRIEFIFLP